MFTKKSLVLFGVKNQNCKAVLTLENHGEMINGRLRLYNFDKPPEGIVSLGFYDNGKVKKCGLVNTSHMLYNFKTTPDISDEFCCGVVNFVGAHVEPLLFGTTQNNQNSEEILGKIAGEVFDNDDVKSVEKCLDENGVEYDESLQKQIDEDISLAMSQQQDRCSACKYKQCFFGEEIAEKKLFIDEIKQQLDAAFENNPPENFLQEAIPSSKWVRVEYDGDGDYYILGLVYDDDQNVKYVCYGVPGVYQKTPPTQLAGYPVWFPLDSDKPQSFGYWLTYQDAQTGQSVKAVVE